MEFADIGVLERQIPTHHRKQHDPRTPDVRLLGRIFLPNQHLGKGVAW